MGIIYLMMASIEAMSKSTFFHGSFLKSLNWELNVQEKFNENSIDSVIKNFINIGNFTILLKISFDMKICFF